MERRGQRSGSHVLRVPAVSEGQGAQAANSSGAGHSRAGTQVLSPARGLGGASTSFFRDATDAQIRGVIFAIFSPRSQNYVRKQDKENQLKGQCHEIFCFWFFLESVSPKPLIIPLGPFQIFSKIRGDIRRSKFATGVKPSSRKILIILFGHLWVVELTYIEIFAFKFTLRCLQPDVVAIVCHRCQRSKWNTLRLGGN